MIRKLRETFRPESSYRAFFITILTFALAHGLYKGIIDNYLAESVGMSAFDKGVSEFFREMPGLALIFVLALLYEFSAVLGLCNSAYAATIKTRSQTAD